MSELIARQSIQTTVRALATFASADVTINDWSILDAPGAMDAAPFLIILGSQVFSATHPTGGPETSWSIEAELFEAWEKDWPTTLENFLATRQALLDGFKEGTSRAPGSSGYYNVQEIRNGGEIVEHTTNDLTYFRQTIIFEVEEWS